MRNTDTINDTYRENSIFPYLLSYIFIVVGFIIIAPFVFPSGWMSSSDFHACIEISSSFIAIISGISCIVYYFGMKSRYFLIIGLGFFISGSEDFLHGLFAFKRLFEGGTVSFSKYIPGTYVAGRILLALCIMAGVIAETHFKTIKNLKTEAVIACFIALVVGSGVTLVAFTLPLPKFIYPDNLIARPADFISAILFVIAFVLIAIRFSKYRDMFSGMLLACILLNAGGQIYMSFSKKLFDIFFDIAHWANIISYCMPLLGIIIEFFHKMSQNESQLNIIYKTSEELKQVIEQVKETADHLTRSSEELSAFSEQMSSSAEETDTLASSAASTSGQIKASAENAATLTERLNETVSDIAAMTENMSSVFENMVRFSQKTSENVQNMARSSDEISDGIHSVASSMEEMTMSLNEVAKHMAEASRVSQNATQHTYEINTKMDILVSASKQIGKIVGVIKDIADQTNMLALNATIEAAGAGEAGKGFAVVAGEVKELAKQSGDATDEISEQIEEIQQSVNEVVLAIRVVSEFINKIADINESIASSAEEQTATASEISKIMVANAATVKNVADNANESADLVAEMAKGTAEASETAKNVAIQTEGLAKGVKNVAGSVDEAATGARNISDSIQWVSQASKETALGAARTNESSAELSRMAAILSGILQRFRETAH